MDRECLEQLVAPLLQWFDENKRVLPWRENPSPYRVWISEIMLQQTRVEAVKPYYDRFLERLPDVESLANVDEEELLKLWEGLGYYNRARNLKKAAEEIVRVYQGVLPREKKELLKLSGIGSYTAGAISSIAYGEPNAAVDGNVLRVIARVIGFQEDILKQSVKEKFEERIETIIPKDRAGAFNQALMELGAICCIPNGEPKCSVCPWERFCVANLEGRTAQIPYKSSKKPRTIEQKTIFLFRKECSFALRKRPKQGLLAGLYEFPWEEGLLNEKECQQYLSDHGIEALRILPLPQAKHVFTHKEWHMTGYEIRLDEFSAKKLPQELIFTDYETAMEKYPIPSAFSVYVKHCYSTDPGIFRTENTV